MNRKALILSLFLSLTCFISTSFAQLSAAEVEERLSRAREYSVTISTFISVIETEYFVLANSQVLDISQLSQDESTQISVLLGQYRVISSDMREVTERLLEIFRASQTDEAFVRLKAARALSQEITKSQEILRLIIDGSLTRERFEQVQEVQQLWSEIRSLYTLQY